jgi:predicted transcriptional regulator of viral defense system
MAMSNTKTKRLDWTKVLTSEARLTDIVAVDELAAKYNLPPDSAWKATSRLAKRGLLSRVSNGVYLNKLVRDASATDFVNVLNPNSYVSLESALNHWGISTQSPESLTCVTIGKPKEYRTPEFAITLRSISHHLFWGFVEKQTRYSKYRIAEPEKALLDWIYLTLQSGLTPHLDEIELRSLDKPKLVKYANRYPGTVRNALANSLVFEHFAA